MPLPKPISWPEGKTFAFSIFDDTDEAQVTTVKPIYDFLHDLGFRTTKSVWPCRAVNGPGPAQDGADCEDPEYLKWILELQSQGFEIGYHLAASRTSLRKTTVRGIERFRELFGDAPITCASHSYNREGMYQGEDRISGVKRLAFSLYSRALERPPFQGHREGDPHFWGDYCYNYVKYYRNFVFGDMNTYKICPQMPYHDPRRPYVRYWFASSEGKVGKSFMETISEANQDRLEAEGGACIMYTHFAYGFRDDGRLEPRFESLMRRLAGKNGWFVPVRTLLDHLLAVQGGKVLTDAERERLEWRWLSHKMRVGRT
jgi:hypothetical protein